ncbi:MAG: low molecular weight protein arginine phosphatase [Candidatus Kaelpia aquatica]|nr:low molecular weight protein arginine phosphatase [Candidatus Kaelpia aquatica]
MKVLFVCTGNSCRSPIAAALLKKMAQEQGLDIETKSCGTAALLGMEATKEAIEVLKREDIRIFDHRSKPLTEELIDWADLILVMEERHRRSLLQYQPQANEKVFLLTEFAGSGKQDIIDPIAKPLEVYEGLSIDLKFYLIKVIERIENENISG